MPNRNLTPDELKEANVLLAEIRERLVALAGDDRALLFAYRRKVTKELGYDERSKPGVRSKLKALNGDCRGGYVQNVAKKRRSNIPSLTVKMRLTVIPKRTLNLFTPNATKRAKRQKNTPSRLSN
jgi:hypothetical protein